MTGQVAAVRDAGHRDAGNNIDADAGSRSAERAVPYYCPFCGEEDLRPEPEPRAAWRCVGCTRVFVVSFVGLSQRDLPS